MDLATPKFNYCLLTYIYIILSVTALSEDCSGPVCASVSEEYVEVGTTSGVTFSCYASETGTFVWIVPAGNECITSCALEPTIPTECQFLTEVISSCQCDDRTCRGLDTSTTFISGEIVQDYVGTWTCEHTYGIDTVTILPIEYITVVTIDLPPGGVIESQPSKFNCTAANGAPAAQIHWFLQDGTNVTDQSTAEVTEGGDPDTLTVISTLTHTFTRGPGQTLRCEAWQLGGKRAEQTTDEINILYAPTSRLMFGDTHISTYSIISGHDLVMMCELTDGNPLEASTYVFYDKDGVIQGCTESTEPTCTVPGITPQQSGEYRCEAQNTAGMGTGTVTVVDVLYPPTEIQFTPDSVVNVTEDSPVTFSCSADSNPAASLAWTFNGDDVDSQDGTVSFKPVNRVNRGNYTCMAVNTMQPTDGNAVEGREEDTLELYVMFGAKTKIGPCEETFNAEKGKEAQLQCIVVEAYPGVNSYKWEVDGVEDTSQTGHTYVIDEVEEDSGGEYRCTGVNVIEVGQQVTPVSLVVQYHPEVVTIAGDTTVIEHTALRLECNTVAVPTDSLIYHWTYPGGTHTGRVLEINRVQINHTGDVECEAHNTIKSCGGESKTDGTAGDIDVIVYYNPKDQPSLQTDQTTIPVEVNSVFTCQPCSGQYPGVPEPDWVVWYKDGSVVTNSTDGFHYIHTSVTVRDSGGLQCQVGNDIGPSPKSISTLITYEAPATIERNEANIETPAYNGDSPDVLTITCDVSASNLDSLYITHNSTRVSQSADYDVSESGPISGDYSYGLDAVYRVEVKWRAAEKAETCDNTVFYNGVYECHTRANTAGSIDNTQALSANIVTHYSPIGREEKNYTVQIGQRNITLPCNICAIPEPAFQWYFDGNIIKGATQQMYMIDIVTSTSFGAYTCHVNNSVGSNNIIMHLLESGIPDNPEDLHFKVDLSTSSSVTVAWTSGTDGNHPPIEHTIEFRPSSTEKTMCNDTIHYSYYGTIESTHLTYTEYVIETLDPDTAYDIRVVTNNQRENEANASEYVYVCNTSTIDTPDIGPFNTELQQDKIIVTWNPTHNTLFGSETYLGLQFHYNVQESDIHDNIHPSANESIDSNIYSYTHIYGDFDLEKVYLMKIYMFEGENKQGTMAPNQPSEITANNISGASVGLIVATVTCSLLFLVMVGAFVVFLLRGAIDWSKLTRDSSTSRSRIRENGVTYENEGFTGQTQVQGVRREKDKQKKPSEDDITSNNDELSSVEKSLEIVAYQEEDLQMLNAMKNQTPENRKTVIGEYQDIDLNQIVPKVDETRRAKINQPKKRNGPVITDYEDVANEGDICETADVTEDPQVTYESLSAQYQNLPVIIRKEPRYQGLTEPLNTDYTA